MPLKDIAKNVEMTYDELLYELNGIVEGGIKINIDYFIKDKVDEDILDEIFDYFKSATTDAIDAAIRKLQEDDISEEEVLLTRIKFISDIAN
jgi:ATP-dependent DNA helicase RecQ